MQKVTRVEAIIRPTIAAFFVFLLHLPEVLNMIGLYIYINYIINKLHN